MGTEHGTSAGYSLLCAIAKQSAWWATGDSAISNGLFANGGLYLAEERFIQDRAYQQVPGSTGQPSQPKGRRRAGKISPSGGFKTGLTADRLGLLMEMIFGAYSSNVASFVNGTALPLYHVAIDKAGVRSMMTKNFRCNKATISSNDDDGNLMLDVEGLAALMDESGVTYPTGVAYPATDVIQHWEATLTIASTAYKFKSIEISIDHDLQSNVFRNSQTRIAIPKGMRTVMANLEVDWSTTGADLYDLWRNNTYFTLSLAYVSSAMGLTIASATAGACFNGETPPINAIDRTVPLKLPIKFHTTNTAQNDELTATVDDS